MDMVSSIYGLKELSKENNPGMLKILRDSPIESNRTLFCFDRDPDIFYMAELKYDRYVFTGFYRLDELVGFALIGYHLAYVNGKPEYIGNLANFFVNNKGRGRGFFYRASPVLFKNINRDIKIGYSVVMQGNQNAESHIARHHEKFPDIPHSKVINTLVVRTILILFKKKESNKYIIRKASPSDIPAIVSLLQKDFSKRLFAPYIDEKTFQKNLEKRPCFGLGNYYLAEYKNKIVGVCAAWDCSSFKQIRILHYGFTMKILKLIISFLEFIFGVPALPAEGKAFKEVYITDYVTENKKPDIMKALLTRINNDYKKRKYGLIIFGSCANDPLLNSTKGFLSYSVRSSIIIGSNEPELLKPGAVDASLPYIDIALL